MQEDPREALNQAYLDREEARKDIYSRLWKAARLARLAALEEAALEWDRLGILRKTWSAREIADTIRALKEKE